MATLRNLETGETIPLMPRHPVGRSSFCLTRLPSSIVSGLHAEFAWHEGAWSIRDLDSRNGTTVDGQRLDPGKPKHLRPGMTVSFASLRPGYEVVDVSPPTLAAVADDDPSVVLLARDDLLALPGPDRCELTIFRDEEAGWLCESDTQRSAVPDRALLEAGGRLWQIFVPSETQRTTEADLADPPSEVGLELTLTRERNLLVSLNAGPLRHDLETRAHSALLLELARARLEDRAQSHLPPSEHGWRHREDLLEALGVDLQRLNLWVFRARQQIAETGVMAPGQVLERRPQAQQLRLGIARLLVSQR